jgi:hypothetical protein
VLSATVTLLAPAAAGLGGLPFGSVAAPAAGLAGLLVAALFAALVGMHAPRPEPGDAADADPEAGWTTGLRRRVAALCAAAFALMGALCAGLAWQSWELQGPGGAVGLAAVALGFLGAALTFTGRALRRN